MHSLRSLLGVLSVLVLPVLGGVDAANGAAILLSDDRRISSDVVVFFGPTTDSDSEQSTPPVPFAPWAETVVASAAVAGNTATATTSQTSAITPTLFTGELSADAVTVVEDVGAAFAEGQAESVFHVTFELTRPHTFVLTYFLDTTDPFSPRVSAGIAFGSHVFTDPTDFDPATATGFLDPGIYDFDASALALSPQGGQGSATAGAFARFDFLLTPVPETSPWLLLGTAVVAGAWFAHRPRGARM